MQKNIVLAVGDRGFEEFFKECINKLIDGLYSPDYDRMVSQVQSIINNQQLPQEDRVKQKHEILLEYFGGNQFLPRISLKKLQKYKDSGIDKINFFDEAPYKESVVPRVSQSGADIVIITERLPGSTDFSTLLHELRVKCSNTQIIVIGGVHEIGDEFLTQVISRGIYNITYGKDVNIGDIIRMVFYPQSYGDVAALLGDNQGSSVKTSPGDLPQFVNPSPIVEPTPKPEKKVFSSKRKKKEPEEHINPPKADTDMLNAVALSPSITPCSGTQMLSIASSTEGFTFLPYDMKPIIITEYQQANGQTVPHYTTLFPDGHVEDGSNLPAVTSPSFLDSTYQQYITSLIDMTREENSHDSVNQFYAAPIKRAKTITFTSARQGVGCSTIALNVACSLASHDHRVLFIDTNFEHSATYARLEMPLSYKGLDDTFKKGNEILQYPLTKQTLVSSATGNNITRFRQFPDSLSFITWSSLFQIGDTHDTGRYIEQTLNTFATDYEYIVIDCNLMFQNYLYDEIYKFSNYINIVVTQDIYEVNLSVERLSHFNNQFDISSKIGVVVNKYCKTPPHPLDFAHDFFNTQRIFAVPEDTKGFITSYANGSIYYMNPSALFDKSSKVKASINTIAEACM